MIEHEPMIQEICKILIELKLNAIQKPHLKVFKKDIQQYTPFKTLIKDSIKRQ